MRRLRLAAVLFSLTLVAAPLYAGEFQCEVLNLKGTATATDKEGKTRALKTGDLLAAGDDIKVDTGGYVDLAYDQDWQNITRLEANSKVKITSIVPGRLDLRDGGVFAKLKKLPQGSSFEVKTPTAVATVRGSEYRTTFLLGQTDVFNAGSSRVVVYGVTAEGDLDKETAVMIEKDKKTNIPVAGQPPQPPADMSEAEKGPVQTLMSGIESNTAKAEKEGRTANIQSVEEMEEFIREEKRKAIAATARPSEPELSRVTDTRRRAFGGDATMAPPEPEQPEEVAEEASAENA